MTGNRTRGSNRKAAGCCSNRSTRTRCWPQSGRQCRSATRAHSMRREDEPLRSLLIVDDDLGFAESLGDMLEPKGYAAVAVDTPERAVAALRHQSGGAPVALIDVRLGGVDSGVDLIPRLRLERPEL